MATKLTQGERDTMLPALLETGWKGASEGDKLQKQFLFENFVAAMAWMNKVADYAEELNHHPEWFNVYGRVDVTLVTHDVDGLSELDVMMASRMDQLAG